SSSLCPPAAETRRALRVKRRRRGKAPSRVFRVSQGGRKGVAHTSHTRKFAPRLDTNTPHGCHREVSWLITELRGARFQCRSGDRLEVRNDRAGRGGHGIGPAHFQLWHLGGGRVRRARKHWDSAAGRGGVDCGGVF